jgi:hypothetical protein
MPSLLAQLAPRLTSTLCRRLYLRGIADIAATAPLHPGALPCTVLSMVQHRDVLPYLVALKTFCAEVPARRTVVVCDPSITPEDRALLVAHVPGLQLHAADLFADPRLPRGGTWERLQAIAAYASEDYVIQLDADTLTLAPLAEVRTCIAEARGFVLGETPNQQVERFETSSKRAWPWTQSAPGQAHIQAVVEADLADAGLPEDEHYVRGCSGFTGFPATRDLREKMLGFATLMRQRHGARWSEWGTEQITSNYLVANTQRPLVLPFPRYGTPDALAADTAFLHFIGYLRFVDRRYERMSRSAIACMPRHPS